MFSVCEESDKGVPFVLFLCSIALKIEEFILHRRGTSENKEFSVPDRKFQILFPLILQRS